MESRKNSNFNNGLENKEIEMEDTSSLFLHADILYDNVKPYLDLKDLSKLARTCKGLNALFQKPLLDAKVEKLLIPLLKFVATGEKEKVEAILKKNPDLLLLKTKAYQG